MPIEREIKLRFSNASDARERILSRPLSATPLRPRRLQDDRLLDTSDQQLFQRRSALRVRSESERHLITFKGPVQPGPVKIREEHESAVGDATVLLTILEQLGLRVWFRYQKYREEFSAGSAVIAVDETPIGVFVEIEGSEAEIATAAAALGKTTDDYITASYRALYVDHCRAHGVEIGDMLFA